MRSRVVLLAVILASFLLTRPATAQTLPPPPATPTPPAQLQPLLDLLSGPGGVLTEPGCATLGTVLGLGAVLVPGLPGTIEQQTGLTLPGLTTAAQPELLRLVDYLLFVQGTGCGLLPLAAERTYCLSDDDLAAAVPRDQLAVQGLPVNPGDFVPQVVPPVGALVDTFRLLAATGFPGAAEVATALEDVGQCELRARFTNVEAGAVPPDTALAAPVAAPIARTVPPPPAAGSGAGLVLPRSPVVAAPPQVEAQVVSRGQAVPPEEVLPRWLQLGAVAALVLFLYRSLAPRATSVRAKGS